MRETRTIEARFTQEGNKLVGYAAVFDTPAEIFERGKKFTEIIRKGAFQRAIKEKQDVVLLVDHDESRLLARTKSGTLRLVEDDHGLRVEADLPEFAAREKEQLQRGDISGMSFSYIAQRDKWTDHSTREVFDVDLFDVTLAVHPAYESTSVSLRSRNAKRRIALLRKMLPED